MIIDRTYYEEFEIDLTGTCNLKCPLCTRNYLHSQHTVYPFIRSLKEIKEQLDTFPNLKTCFLAGQVSEPTLYPEFIEYLKYLKYRNIKVKLFSNGSTNDLSFWKNVGKTLEPTDEVHFTICGSTQELHEIYRVNSSLEMILNNAAAYREANNNNDYCQFIKFIYNMHDEVNVKKFKFTNHYTVGSEGDRIYNEKIIKESHAVRPEKNRDTLIKWLLLNKPEKPEIECVSIKNKKIYITQTGQIYPCYMHCEYSPEDISFKGKSFDYSNILCYKFHECFLCDKKLRSKVNTLGLDFLC